MKKIKLHTAYIGEVLYMHAQENRLVLLREVWGPTSITISDWMDV